MAFDLRIAVKRDPTEARSTAEPVGSSVKAPWACVSLVVNGMLDESGCNELMFKVRRSFQKGAASVIVDMQNVALPNVACLQRLADSIMAERSAGHQVQVVARDAALHARCCSIADARDWLIADPNTDVAHGRRAIHLDTGHGAA